MTIVKGTTPSIIFTFETINPLTIKSAIFTITQSGKIIMEKNLDDAIIGSSALTWNLSQEETLAMSGSAVVMCNWLTQSGLRGVSKKLSVAFDSNPIDEVMT